MKQQAIRMEQVCLNSNKEKAFGKGSKSGHNTIVRVSQLCSKFPPTALLNFACDWLALDRNISFGRLNSPNV